MFAASKSGKATASTPPPPTPTNDPQFPYVTALLTGDGTNGAQNNTFIDSSPNNFTITRAGNTTQGSVSPYGGNWSNYFDGNGDYLSVPSNTAFAFGTGNFTVECFFNLSIPQSTRSMHLTDSTETNGLFLKLTSGNVSIGRTGTAEDSVFSYSFLINTWYHVAFSRSGTTVYCFVNGSLVGSTTNSINYAQGGYTIGAAGGAAQPFEGYISNLRMLKGTALYTAAFTPITTPLTAITNTQLLICQSPRFVDNSFNNFTVTKNGDVSVQVFSPFEPATLTPISYSGYFDGNGDYLNTPNNAAFGFGTGDFTIEGWFYFTGNIGTYQRPWWFGDDNENLEILSSVIRFGGGSITLITGPTAVANTWCHIAYSRQSGSGRLFVNGVQGGATTASSYNSSARTFTAMATSGGANACTGYVSNLRIVKGTALYTANFTPSTTPLTAITNTSLLTCQSNTFVDNSPNNFAITPAGDAKTTIQNPFGTFNYSQYFDGTGDYLSLATNAAFNITSGSTDSFICEFWVKFSSVAANTSLVDNGGLSGATLSNWNIQLNASQQFGIVWGNEGAQQGILASSTVPTTGQWYHIAMVKTNADWALFINGARGISYNGINTASKSSATALYIGYGITTSAGGNGLNGVVSNVRIYKGATASAPYLATSTTITVPTAPLTAITNTSLLTCQNLGAIDNSTNAFTITAYGNTSGSTINPFPPTPAGLTSALTTGYSASVASGAVTFNGTGDVLTGPTSNTVFQLTGNGGTGLTVEAWIYPTSVAGSRQIATYYSYTDGGSEQGWYFRVLDGQLIAGNAFGGTSRGGGSIPVNTWTHVAFVINSGSFYLYLNGVSIGSVTGVGSQSYSSATLEIGGIKQNGTYTNQVFKGSISNLRTTNTAVYTANFTPPTSPLTAVSGTSLLTCQSSTSITDASSNGFTITRVGTPVTTVANPFGITSVNGASMYFDGNGDYLSVPANSAFTLGTNNHTIEFYYYLPSTTLVGGYATQWQLDSSASGQASNSYYFQIGTAGGSNVALLLGAGGSWGVLMQPSISINSFVGVWTHIAFTRSGSTFRLFFNGVQASTATYSGSITAQSGPMFIGRDGGGNYAGGYYSNFRINNGTAVYTSNFVPPVAPITVVSNTSLLLNGTNGGIIDNAMMNNYETVGNAQISTSVVKYGTGSMYFDGTGDYLSIYNPSYSVSVGSGDFTYECWLYVNALPGLVTSVYHLKNDTGLATTVFVLELTTNGAISISTGTAIIAYGTAGKITTGSWIHFACVRTSGVFKTFFNGIQDISVANTTAYNGTYLYIGAWRYSSYDNSLNGYLDDVRITKGYARYVANFTPPTQAFPTY